MTNTIDEVIQPGGGLYSLGWYLCWDVGSKTAILDGHFTADELRAVANHMDETNAKHDR